VIICKMIVHLLVIVHNKKYISPVYLVYLTLLCVSSVHTSHHPVGHGLGHCVRRIKK
jgi:hypothetical protein